MWAKDSIQQVKERAGIANIETVHGDPSLSCLHACRREEERGMHSGERALRLPPARLFAIARGDTPGFAFCPKFIHMCICAYTGTKGNALKRDGPFIHQITTMFSTHLQPDSDQYRLPQKPVYVHRCE